MALLNSPVHLIKGDSEIYVDEFRRFTIDEDITEMSISKSQDITYHAAGGHAAHVAKPFLVPVRKYSLYDALKIIVEFATQPRWSMIFVE